jgi:galactokinase
MRAVCQEFGVQQCRAIDAADFYAKIAELRRKVGDRAILRCAHFFAENERVNQVKTTLQSDDFTDFLDLINARVCRRCAGWRIAIRHTGLRPGN